MDTCQKELLDRMKDRGIVPGLDTMEALLDVLGHPEESFSVVHFAGTNGKGSTIAFLDSILEEAGYRVGRYISPMISCKEEQFQINGSSISKEDLAVYYDLVKDAACQLEMAGKDIPTVFEAETAIAFLYFRDQKVDFALVECGMGGLLDATNVIKSPVLTVITSISYDHMGFLGHSLAEIAGQKAGIIKQGVPVILAENQEEAAVVVRNRAASCHSRLIEIKDEQYKILHEDYDGSTFLWGDGYCEEFRIVLPGSHQVSNAVTALTAAFLLLEDAQIREDDHVQEDGQTREDSIVREYGLNREADQVREDSLTHADSLTLEDDQIQEADQIQKDQNVRKNDQILKDDLIANTVYNQMRRGLYKTRWPARLEIIGRDPLVFRDGAHNVDGAVKLADFLQKHFTNRRIIYIMGVLKDKEYEKMVACLLPLSQMAYVFKPDNDRGLEADLLAECVRKSGREVLVCQGVKDALTQALAQANKDDVLVVCGSLSFMGELS